MIRKRHKKPKKPPSVLIRLARKEYLPNITRRIKQMESGEELDGLEDRIKNWHISADSFYKSKEEIKELKLEAGQIIVDFNYWFADRDGEGYQEI